MQKRKKTPEKQHDFSITPDDCSVAGRGRLVKGRSSRSVLPFNSAEDTADEENVLFLWLQTAI